MAEEKEFHYDPEAEENAKKFRLPFALCKANGIAIQDWWTPRDAWEALRRNGDIENVSDEYADYYRKLKKEQAKKRRKANKERNAIRRAQRKDPEHNPDPNYKHVDGQIAGAKKGREMTFEQADSGAVNPYYDTEQIGYHTNCQTCVATFIARRRGYDVRALPNLDNRNIMQLSWNPLAIYKDKDGRPPIPVVKKYGVRTSTFIDEQVKEGRIYSVSVKWGGRNSGHIVTAERVNGIVQVYDPQTNSKYTGRMISAFFRRVSNVRVADLTDCEIDETYADKIMKRSKK